MSVLTVASPRVSSTEACRYCQLTLRFSTRSVPPGLPAGPGRPPPPICSETAASRTTGSYCYPGPKRFTGRTLAASTTGVTSTPMVGSCRGSWSWLGADKSVLSVFLHGEDVSPDAGSIELDWGRARAARSRRARPTRRRRENGWRRRRRAAEGVPDRFHLPPPGRRSPICWRTAGSRRQTPTATPRGRAGPRSTATFPRAFPLARVLRSRATAVRAEIEARVEAAPQ